jgi:3-methyladenine DNA glycosylase AlkD
MTKTACLKEVEKIIKTAPSKWVSKDVVFLKKYIGTQYDIKGLSIPAVRSIYKTGFSFSKLNIEDQIEIWDYIWQNSNLHEALSLAIFFWEKNIDKLDITNSWNCIKNWTAKIDNWAHSDGLSGLYSDLLEAKPKTVLPQLKKWSKSKNPWERRQSVVGLVHYHRKRNNILPYSVLIPFVENLLGDKDYFVQKGVGWALREIGNAYNKETFAFLKKHYAEISGVAFSVAAEKLNNKEKEELKALRKSARKK